MHAAGVAAWPARLGHQLAGVDAGVHTHLGSRPLPEWEQCLWPMQGPHSLVRPRSEEDAWSRTVEWNRREQCVILTGLFSHASFLH